MTRRPKRQRCQREGCTRGQADGQTHCTALCRNVDYLLSQAQRITEATGVGDHYASAVAVSDAVTAYYKSDNNLFQAARSEGITPEQWRAIKQPHR